ncbi:MAG: 3-dehydroquinate synthase [Bacteroidales bacterium]|nr:3-dehydroquinate synthase [Bacteroidales bacterium]
MQHILYAQNLVADLREAVARTAQPDRIVLLTDATTHALCAPLVREALPEATDIVIGATDAHKTLDTLASVWQKLQAAGCTRHSLLINLGGGMVTDLGGFAAASFKRGLRFINVPTTLLAMVDAAVGGKTGINFGGLKNEIGAFCEAETVLVAADFLRTLDAPNLCSGYAEMLKHALLDSVAMWERHLAFDLQQPDFGVLQSLVAESIAVKQRIVQQDPHERGLRKALNLGHTTAHAFESLMLHRDTPVLHGYAVAWGMVVELFMSAVKLGFPTERMRQTVRYIVQNYGRPNITCDDYEQLYALMLHDKKNVAGHINFTLLSDVGEIVLDQSADRALLDDALDFLRES